MSSKAAATTLATLLITTALPNQALAFDKGDLIVRAGITLVAPNEETNPLAFNGSESVLNGVLGGETELSVDNDTQLGLTVEYMLTKNWGIEVLAATPFKHTAEATGALDGLKVADFKHLPPTISAVYHFDFDKTVQPYIGVGLNYTFFFSEDVTADANSAFSGLGLTGAEIELEDSIGLSVQVGVDYHISNLWSLNGSVRWIDIDTEADVVFDSGDEISTDISVDPVVYTIALGRRF